MVVSLSFKNGGLSVLQERWSLCPSRKMVPLSLENRGLSILKEWWSLIRIVLHQGYHHNNFCVELLSLWFPWWLWSVLQINSMVTQSNYVTCVFSKYVGNKQHNHTHHHPPHSAQIRFLLALKPDTDAPARNNRKHGWSNKSKQFSVARMTVLVLWAHSPVSSTFFKHFF